MSLGKRIKQARKAKGLTLDELAMHVNTSKGYLSDLENGKNSNPTVNRIYHISKILSVSIDYLVSGKKEVK